MSPSIGVLPSVEGNAEAVLDPDRTVIAAIAAEGMRPKWVILQHKGQAIGTVGIAAKVDVEGGLEVVGEVDALVEHRRASLTARIRRQHKGVVHAVVGGRAVESPHHSTALSDLGR